MVRSTVSSASISLALPRLCRFGETHPRVRVLAVVLPDSVPEEHAHRRALVLDGDDPVLAVGFAFADDGRARAEQSPMDLHDVRHLHFALLVRPPRASKWQGC